MSNFDRYAFAQAVHELLLSEQWTGSELALKTDLSQSQVSRILGAKLKRFSASHQSLCTFMHISPTTFMKDTVVTRSSLIEAVDTLCENDPDREAALERLLSEIAHLAVPTSRHQRR